MTPLIAADFFAGAGGLSLGFGQAGYRMAFANEIWPEYAATYQQNRHAARTLALVLHRHHPQERHLVP